MLYELRFYEPHPGRLPDLLARFRDRLPPLFDRHGIHCVGQWVTDDAGGAAAPSARRFAYLTVFPDLARREAAWAGFGEDPHWHRARTESNGGSEMLRGYDLFLLRPRHAPAVQEEAFAAQGMHELLFQRMGHGQGECFSNLLRQRIQPTLVEAGATVVGCFDLIAGTRLPQSLLWVHWPAGGRAGRAGNALASCTELATDGQSVAGCVPLTMRRAH